MQLKHTFQTQSRVDRNETKRKENSRGEYPKCQTRKGSSRETHGGRKGSCGTTSGTPRKSFSPGLLKTLTSSLLPIEEVFARELHQEFNE